MKYTKSALGLLNAQYRSVLKKCLLINLGLFALSAPAMADSQVVVGPGQTWAPETATTITGVSSDEGALTVKSGTIAANVNVTLSDNTSTSHGAALYYKDQNATSVQSEFSKDVTFSGNTSTANSSSGGAVFVSGGKVSFLGETNKFINNSITGTDADEKLYKRGGGAIDNQSYENESSHSTIDSVMVIGTADSTNTFTGNTSSMNGGAVMNRAVDTDGNATLTINGNSTFSGNSATGLGGAIYNIQRNGRVATVNINGTALFENNTAANGEANDIYNTGTLNLNATTVNDAIVLNGGIDGDSGNKGTTNISGAGYVKVANALKNQNVTNSGELQLDGADLTGTTIGGTGTLKVIGDSEMEGNNTINQDVTVEDGQKLDITNATIDGTGNLANASGGTLNINNSTLNGGALTNASGGTLKITDSTIKVNVNNAGTLISDPTTYDGVTVANSGLASFDADTFQNAAILNNTGVTNLSNGVTFKDTSKITGTGTTNLVSGTTHFNNTTNANTINLLSGANFDGTLNGGKLNTQNGTIDTISGAIQNATLALDVNTTTGTADTFGGITSSTIESLNVTGAYGTADDVTIALGSGVSLASGASINGGYYTKAEIDSSGNLKLSDKLINTSTIRGTDATGETVTIADKAETTNIGTTNAKISLSDSGKTATVTAANGLVISNGTPAQDATLKADANGLNSDKTILVGTNGTKLTDSSLVIDGGANDATLTATANGLNVDKGLTVATNKFTVDTSGNTVVGGNFTSLSGKTNLGHTEIASGKDFTFGGKTVNGIDGTTGTGNTTLATVATVTDKINKAAGNGLTGTSGVLAVGATDKSITVGADGIAVNVYANGGLETNSTNGLQIKAGDGVKVDASGLAVKAEDSTITVGTGGIKVGTITATNLDNLTKNNLLDAATTSAGLTITDGTASGVAKIALNLNANGGLEEDATNGLQIKSQGVTSDMIKNGTITGEDIASDAALSVATITTTGKASVASLALGGTDISATAAEINQLHDSGVTKADLTKLHAVTADAAELNLLDGMTAVDGTTGTGSTTLATVATVTDKINNAAGAGLKSSGGVLSLDLTAKGGLQLDGSGDAATLSVLTDNSTIVKDATTGALKVGTITVSNIAADSITTATEVAALIADPTTASDTKLMTEAAVATGINAIMTQKEAWIGNELGYDTTTTDAHTILGAAGFTDQTGDGKLGVVDAALQLNTKIGDVDYSDETAVTGSVLKTGAGATTTVRGALDALDDAVKNITTDTSTGEINVANANVGTQLKVGTGTTLTTNTVSTTTVNATTVNAGANGTALTDNSLLLKGSGAGVQATLTGTANGLNVAEGLTVGTAGSEKFKVTSGGNTTVGGTLDVIGASTFTGAVTANGALTANGNVTLGDAAADTITVKGTATFAELITATNGIKAGTNSSLVDGTLTVGNGSTSSVLTSTTLKVGAANVITASAGSLDMGANSLKNIRGLTLEDSAGNTATLSNDANGFLTGNKDLNVGTAALKGGTLTTTGNATVGGTLQIGGASGPTLTGTASSLSSDMKIISSKGFEVDANNSLTSGSFKLAGTEATSINNAAITRNTAGSATALATTATVVGTIANQAQDATYTNSVAATDSNITGTTLNAALANLDTEIGADADYGTGTLNNGVSGTNSVKANIAAINAKVGNVADVTVNGYTASSGTLTGAVSALNTNMTNVLGGVYKADGTYDATKLTSGIYGQASGTAGNLTTSLNNMAANVSAATGTTYASDGSFTNTYTSSSTTVSYGVPTATTNLATAIGQVATNVGTAAQFTAGKGNVAATNTVNANLNTLDAAIGDRSNIGSANAAINTAVKTDVATAVKQIGDEIGTQTYVNNKTVNYGAIVANTDLTTAVSQVASNVGTASDFATTTKGNVAATNTVNANLNMLDNHMGNLTNLKHNAFGVATPANVADITTAMNSLATNVATGMGGSFATDGSWSDTVVNTTSNGYTYTPTANIMDSLDQVAGNVGTAAQLTNAYNGVATSQSVNTNLNAINGTIGNITTLSTDTGGSVGNALSNGTGVKPTTVVTALNNIDATLGKIHGLKASSDLGDKSNLASGTTVENHLVSLDNAIGDRSFTTTRYVAPNSDLATAVTALDSNLSRVEHKVNDLRHDFEAGMASMAAMSALVPNPRSSGDTSLSIGTGAYGGHTAVAFGGFHYLTDNILLNAGASWGNSDDMAYRLGVTWSW